MKTSGGKKMFCTKCGNEIDNDAVICPKCGCLVSNEKISPTSTTKPHYASLVMSCISFGLSILLFILGILCTLIHISTFTMFLCTLPVFLAIDTLSLISIVKTDETRVKVLSTVSLILLPAFFVLPVILLLMAF